VSLAERPELAPEALAMLDRGWPPFIWQARGPEGRPGIARVLEQFPETQLVFVEDGAVRVVCNAVVLGFDGPGEELPPEGWDWAVARAFSEQDGPGGVLCALAVTVEPGARGRGLSRAALRALLALAARLQLSRLVVPVRPPTLRPEQSVDDLLQRPADDPWLRTHLGLGGRIVQPCRRSMTLSAPLSAWERWGPAGRIAPLSRDGQTGVYVEPNVWVEHRVAVTPGD